MQSVKSIGRGVAALSGLTAMFLIGAGTVAGATTLVLDPDRATPGTRITIYNACLGVTDEPPEAITTAFVSTSRPDRAPADPLVPRAVARALTGPDRYVVVVPKLKPGLYDIRLECLPGDWRTNTAEGVALRLKVLAGAPDTSVSELVGSPDPADNGPMGPLLISVGIAGWVVTYGRLTHRRLA